MQNISLDAASRGIVPVRDDAGVGIDIPSQRRERAADIVFVPHYVRLPVGDEVRCASARRRIEDVPSAQSGLVGDHRIEAVFFRFPVHRACVTDEVNSPK